MTHITPTDVARYVSKKQTEPRKTRRSRAAREHDATVRTVGGPTIVTFGHLTRFPAEKLHAYRRALEYLAGATQIRWSVYAGHPFRVDHPNNVALLQVADAAASGLFKAVEPDDYGNTETRYLEALAPKLYRRGAADVTSYGLKVFPKSECEKGGSLEFLGQFWTTANSYAPRVSSRSLCACETMPLCAVGTPSSFSAAAMATRDLRPRVPAQPVSAPAG
ncbi:MAG TPA: hypothetical protein VII01_01270 [Solirubrobacteraceae bacterium]